MTNTPRLLPTVLRAVFLLTVLPGTAPAQETPPPAAQPDAAQLLREALFDEQGLRDPAKAAAGYEKIIAAYDAARPLAATALFRLAEIHRAQTRNDEAARLYQRLLTEFPSHDPLARLSREALAALGVKELPDAAVAGMDPEDIKIADLKKRLKESPDLVTAPGSKSPLLEAAKDGQTKVADFLLQSGVKPTAQVLEAAASHGQLGVCKLLISKGADVKGSAALPLAVNLGFTEIVRLLLSAGADPDYLPEKWPDSSLYQSIAKGFPEITTLLIEAKANPNLPPPAQSPLYFAVRNGDLPLAKRLLTLGADVKVRARETFPSEYRRAQVRPPTNPEQKFSSTPGPEGWTLLHAAVASGSPEMLELILSLPHQLEDPGPAQNQTPLGLAVELAQTAAAERLLKEGANPKANGPNGRPLLFEAADQLNESMVKLLLAAGADATATLPDGQTVLTSLFSHGEETLPLMRLLIAAGATPQENQPIAAGPLAVKFVREFCYPVWRKSDEVTLSLPESGGTLSLASRSGNSQASPPSLADLMLEAKFRWVSTYPPEWTKVHLHRRDAQGQLQPLIIIDWTEGPGPALQWGDIVEFVSANWQTPRESRDTGLNENLPPEVQNRLRAALVRHVTVTLDGKTWPMTLRGALKVYNPLKPEAPLTDAVTLIKMMGAADLRWFNASVKVTRLPEQGGGEISSKITKGATIPLKDGDILELIGEPAKWERINSFVSIQDSASDYTNDLVLISPGLPFSKRIGTSVVSSPSLLQFLAAAYPPPAADSLTRLVEAENSGSVLELTGKTASKTLTDGDLQSVLPHPDWSQIKIRRILESGKIEEIPVNLAAAIAACTDATPPGEARKADVELMPGDTILLPTLQDSRDQPWKGWDAETIRFFSKALAMQVTLADNDGSFRALDLEYMPVRYVETAAGLLGLPAKEPAPNLLTYFSTTALVASAAPGKFFASLQRPASSNPAVIDTTGQWFWLRDRDSVGISGNRPISLPGAPNSPPRRQVILPPSN